MSIKQNIKRRMLMMLALAMMVAVLGAGTAHAQSQGQPTPELISLTQTASSPEVAVGEPVTFHTTVTNDGPNTISDAQVLDALPAGVQFVSASSSQGQCTFKPSFGKNGFVECDLGTLPPGGTAQIDVVLVPQEMVGSITNKVGGGIPGRSSEATVWVGAA
jgi:uncharacterized repeat protein (TIGR01451 family)